MISGKSAPVTGKYLHTAYLLSRYPAVSHTFFLQEIAGLRERGLSICTASINPPDRPHTVLSPPEQAEAQQTFYLKGQSKVKQLAQLAAIVFANPGAAWRGFKAAFLLEPWHLSHTLYALFYFAESMLLGAWMRSRKLNHLHIHFSGPVASVGMLASLAWQIPYSITVHGPDEFFDQHEGALPQKIRHATFVVCISEFCRSQLMRISPPSSWSKFHVVRLGIAPALASTPFRSDISSPIELLCTGRLVGAKGQAVLLLALASLVQKGHALRLTLIGDGEDRRVLEQLTDAHHVRPFVVFAGAQSHDQVLEALHSADLFVLPSFAEGVPVALMEAMAIGVPCISTFVAGIPELIRPGQDGLLVPAGSVSELAAAIERLILEPELRDRLRTSARAHVLAQYDLPKNLELLADTFAALAPHAVPS